MSSNDTKIQFYDEGTEVHVHSLDLNSVSDKLPPRVYSVEFNQIRGFYLKKDMNTFVVPQRIYGSAVARAERVLTSHFSRTKSTGVLSTGDKGSGKTMLACAIANGAIERGLPVLTISQGYSGNGFVNFIRSIGDCVIVLDEFGKVFDESEGEQDGLLTLMDGLGQTRILFLMTENREKDVSEYILGRTGRVLYHFEYDKLETAVIDEYCADHGLSEIVPDIMDVYNRCLEFSFDNLSAIVEEVKRFPDQDVVELIGDMNIRMWKTRQSFDQIQLVSLVDDSGTEYNIRDPQRLRDCPIDSNDSVLVHYSSQSNPEDSDCDWVGRNMFLELQEDGHMVYKFERGNGTPMYLFVKTIPAAQKHHPYASAYDIPKRPVNSAGTAVAPQAPKVVGTKKAVSLAVERT